VKLLLGPGTRPAFWLLVETRIAADTRPGGLPRSEKGTARKKVLIFLLAVLSFSLIVVQEIG
jgi:hypothetical protein